MPDPHRAEISMHHIPIKGGIGVGILIAMLVTMMLIDLPQLRWPVLGSIALGVVFGVALIVWRFRAKNVQGCRNATRAPNLLEHPRKEVTLPSR